MDPATAADLLGVGPRADLDAIRRAWRIRIRRVHPDARGHPDGEEAAAINRAYDVLIRRIRDQSVESDSPDDASEQNGTGDEDVLRPPVGRPTSDTLVIAAPVDEAFRRTFDAAHDVGTISYVDRSGPILEVLCRFVDEPATSLLLTFQGRSDHTEIHGTAESIEDRPGPPVGAVLDLLELALRERMAR